MPIRFRCPYCNRLLGIATRKAGTETTCPHCGHRIAVPVPLEGTERTERTNLEEVEELLARGATEAVPQSVATAAPAQPNASVQAHPAPVLSAPPPTPVVHAPKVRPAPTDDPPLFEGDMDAILGITQPSQEAGREKPPAVTGPDAMSLGEPARHIVISAQKATLLMLLVVVLMALSFAAGMFLKG